MACTSNCRTFKVAFNLHTRPFLSYWLIKLECRVISISYSVAMIACYVKNMKKLFTVNYSHWVHNAMLKPTKHGNINPPKYKICKQPLRVVNIVFTVIRDLHLSIL